MSQHPPSPPAQLPPAMVIAPALRWICGLGSVTLYSVGGVAVFTTSNDVGTAALLTVGLFLSIVALLGRVPRVKLGDNEIDPTALWAQGALAGADYVADAVKQESLGSADPEQIAQAVESRAHELVRFLMPRIARVETYRDKYGDERTRMYAANGQLIGVVELPIPPPRPEADTDTRP